MGRGLDELKEEYMETVIPGEGKEKVRMIMEKASKDKNNKKIVRFRKYIVATAAAVAAVCIILPNTSASVAMAMENLPVIGGLFKVITFRDYQYDDGHSSANVEVPQIEVTHDELPADPVTPAVLDSGTGVAELNKSVEEYTDMLVKQFEADAATMKEGYQGLDVTYDVVTDNAEWFTLNITILETKASGFEQHKFYHIDKRTGNIAQLEDLFQDGKEYVTIISEEIKKQMRANTAANEGMLYFLDSEDMPEEDFQQIQPNENFYINDAGEIVIVFDEYEVAPGYMGSPEFTIPADVLQGIRK